MKVNLFTPIPTPIPTQTLVFCCCLPCDYVYLRGCFPARYTQFVAGVDCSIECGDSLIRVYIFCSLGCKEKLKDQPFEMYKYEICAFAFFSFMRVKNKHETGLVYLYVSISQWLHDFRFPIWIYHSDDHDFYGLPIHGNTGSKIGIDAGGPTVTPQTRTFTPDPVREKACIDLLQQILPSVSIDLRHTWNVLFLNETITIIAFEPWHEISNNLVCSTSKGSEQPAHTRRLIRAFAGRLNILWLLNYWPNLIWGF